MEIVVRGRNFDVSDRFREHAEQRLQRLEHHGSAVARIDVEVTKQANPRLAEQAIQVELTCIGRGPVVRAESADADKFAAFDAAADRLAERLRRADERRRVRARNHGKRVKPHEELEVVLPPIPESAPPEPELDVDADVVFEEGPVVVREKTHETSPMTVEQALDAMELVGHDFYLFLDVANGQPSVVYRRRGYDYGLIRLQVSTDAEAVS